MFDIITIYHDLLRVMADLAIRADLLFRPNTRRVCVRMFVHVLMFVRVFAFVPVCVCARGREREH